MFGKSMGGSKDPSAASQMGSSGASMGASSGASDSDDAGPIAAACAALKAAQKMAGVADALDSAQVITLSFQPDGSIEVDVDGESVTVSADEVMGGSGASDGASGASGSSGASMPSMPGAPPPQF